jgi:hypothetical protein
MRLRLICLAASLVLLGACRDQADTASSPAATEPAATTADAPPQERDLRADAAGNRPGEPGLGPDHLPRIVTDTTPVDTTVTTVKLADKADDKHLTGRVTDQFKPSDGVFMSIHTDGTAGKYTLSAKWKTPAGDTLTEYSQAITMAGPVDTIFSLSKPDGWAPGQYSVELSINGKLMRSVPFTVR